MATRATIRFATREEGVPFDKHPQQWHAQFYRHWDGYPEGLGIEIAESFVNYQKLTHWEVESLDIVHGDIEYLYYIWQCHGKSEPWISIFQMIDWNMPENSHEGKCIFVGTPDMLLKKFAPEQIETEEFLCDDCDCTESERDVCTN
tara:strand:+ start:546 stop:983 length:438 start_codon:yes stop_codon:yes gene_type:complete